MRRCRYLQNNRLTGTIPDVFSGSFSNLGYADFSNNDLSGTIPASFNDLTQLQQLCVTPCRRWA